MSNQEEESYNEILSKNRNYSARMLEKNGDYFSNLAKGQNPEYLIIGCSDSRVPSDLIIKEETGEFFVHRNIANQVLPVDGNVNSVIQFACAHLRVKHIVVLGHTNCGGIKAALDRVHLGGQLDLWLGGIRDTINRNLDYLSIFEDSQKLYQVCRLNVMDQVHNIWKNPFVQKCWQDGEGIWVHGWIFHVETGRIEEVILENKMPKDLQDSFLLKPLQKQNDKSMPEDSSRSPTQPTERAKQESTGLFSCFECLYPKSNKARVHDSPTRFQSEPETRRMKA